jgi:hypothetical protein
VAAAQIASGEEQDQSAKAKKARKESALKFVADSREVWSGDEWEKKRGAKAQAGGPKPKAKPAAPKAKAKAGAAKAKAGAAKAKAGAAKAKAGAAKAKAKAAVPKAKAAVSKVLAHIPPAVATAEAAAAAVFYFHVCVSCVCVRGVCILICMFVKASLGARLARAERAFVALMHTEEEFAKVEDAPKV